MVDIITQNHFGVNTYVLYDNTKECVLVDVCSQTEREKQEIRDFIKSKGLVVKHILLTHPHIDHLCGAEFACEEFGLPLTVSASATDILQTAAWQAVAMGFNPMNMEKVNIKTIVAGEDIHFGESKLKSIECSGHCPGSLCYYNQAEAYIITGDALFSQSIGRTDLQGGDLDLLLQNIRENILTLSDTTIVYPGHGPETTVKDEKDYNPFLS
jgi:glyoxylase-like metal-dependent hydrolase (beta-lactamase superfamily II)